MIIRKAIPSDAPAITELVVQLGYPADNAVIHRRIERLKAMDDHILLVASLDEEVVGWMQAHSCDTMESGFRVEIIGLVVAANSRRSGIGRALVAAAEEWATCLGADAIIVRSNVKRIESHRFYPAVGYTTSKTQLLYRKTIESPAGK